MDLIFEWDKNKAKSNLQKHGVDFDEAKSIFDDEHAVTYPDESHSEYEARFISIGVSSNKRILLVVHTEQDKAVNEIIIRIISCRKATANERRIYEKEI